MDMLLLKHKNALMEHYLIYECIYALMLVDYAS
jgi:hypothetical protein